MARVCRWRLRPDPRAHGHGQDVRGPDGAAGAGASGDADAPPPLTLLWITPLRALAADTTLAVTRATAALRPHWTVGLRTGDTASGERARQDRRLPTILVTTPESLTLLLSRADWRERLAHLDAVVVDEWHELLGTKRGVQAELGAGAPAPLGGPTLRTWGALRHARQSRRRPWRACVGIDPPAAHAAGARASTRK